MSKYTEREYKTYCEIRGNIVGARIVLAFYVGIIFVALKLVHQIGWGWWAVTSPLWGAVAYGIIAALGILILGMANA